MIADPPFEHWSGSDVWPGMFKLDIFFTELQLLVEAETKTKNQTNKNIFSMSIYLTLVKWIISFTVLNINDPVIRFGISDSRTPVSAELS